MSEKPKRPWFRFHLLTAVLMMLAVGGIMWLNVSVRETYCPQSLLSEVFIRNGGSSEFEKTVGRDQHELLYGWPIEFAEYDMGRDQWYFRDGFSGHSYRRWFLIEDGIVAWSGKWLKWFPVFLLPDVLVWIGILILITLVSEFFIRRREGRRP